MIAPQLPAGRWAAEPQRKEGTGLPRVCAFNLGRPASLCDFSKGEGLSWLHQNHSSTRKEALGEEGTPVPEPSYISRPPCQTWTQTFQFPWHNVVLRMFWCYQYFLPLPVLQLEITKYMHFLLFVPNAFLSFKKYLQVEKERISTLQKFYPIQILYILYRFQILYILNHLVCFSFLNSLWLFFHQFKQNNSFPACIFPPWRILKFHCHLL